MPSKRALRSAVAAQQEQLDASAKEDYLGQFPAKRAKTNAGAKGRKQGTKATEVLLSGRASRATRRAAAKHSNTEQPEDPTGSTRSGKRERMIGAEEEEDDVNGDDDDDDDYQEEEGGVSHDLMARTINQGRHGPQRTINGIAARHYEQSQDQNEEESEEGEEGEEQIGEDDHEEGLHMIRPPEESRGRGPGTVRDGHGGASMPNRVNTGPATRSKGLLDTLYEFNSPSPEKTQTHQRVAARRGAKNKETAPRRCNRPTTSQPRQPVQNQVPREESAASSEREGEARGDTRVDAAEVSAFIEAPQPHEKLVLVEVNMNSMGGIFKTLKHQAWTSRSDWNLSFEADDKSDGDPTACKTTSGKTLMKAAVSLKRLLENAIHAWQESEETGNDDIRASTEYLRGKGADAKRCLAGIDRAVERICAEELAPPPPAADEESAKRAVQTRRRLLCEISRRLIPMLVLIVNKTCGLALSEGQSKVTVYFNHFTFQFFLRTISWTTRLHNALSRGLEQWPYEPEFKKNATDLDEKERKAKQGKMEARRVFSEQLSKLHYAAKHAERTIQEAAARKVENQRREAYRRRAEEQARLARAAHERKEEEKRQRDAALYAHCARHSQSLMNMPDPEQERWLRDEAARKRAIRDAFTQNNGPGRASQESQGYRKSGMVQVGIGPPRVGPSRNTRIEEDPNDWDPFAESPPFRNRTTPSIQYTQDRPNSSGIRHRPSQANRPWAYKEEKALVKAIRYDGTYNVVSMAARLGRSEGDVERRVLSLLQGYRARYTERAEEIPAWLSYVEETLGISSPRSW
ncbi:hypothetical protein VSDG_01364 [Cytospora chrysosperma]|uniref:Uncharacterized protein n=1 Tax=Cytospora chrysosperma TaxID=252740 RepID=A0A423WJB3_CYTCH|nr:hypothetical protein VSDG_01364 [Valsa sordida]